jgi:hypothetical protein
MPPTIGARLARLEEAEERRDLAYWAPLFAAAYGINAAEARDVLARATAACKRCATFGDDTYVSLWLILHRGFTAKVRQGSSPKVRYRFAAKVRQAVTVG